MKADVKNKIDSSINKYNNLRSTHMDIYDREFSFKLNGDT